MSPPNVVVVITNHPLTFGLRYHIFSLYSGVARYLRLQEAR